MKKIKIILTCMISVSILLFSQRTNAQINLEHTFEGYVPFAGQLLISPDSYEFAGDAEVFIRANLENNQIKLYNTDYSLYKNIDIIPPTGYKWGNVYFFTKKLFNNDDKIEFMAHFFEDGGVGGAKLLLYNEDGTIIKDFGVTVDGTWFLIYKINEQFKLILYKTLTGQNATEIYSLPGTLSIESPKIGTSFLQPPYPNPANSTITLPYQLKQGEISIMRIYNINGQLIESKHIGSDFDKILLNVSNYRKGMYIYEVNGESKRFIVK